MIKKLLFIFIFCLQFLSVEIFAQSQFPGYFFIYFTDKNQSIYSVNQPQQFLSSRAIERRTKFNIDITSNDFPVNQKYLDSLQFNGLIVKHSSKWMNAALVEVSDSMLLENIKKLNFFSSMKYLGPIPPPKKKNNQKRENNKERKVETQLNDFGETYHQLDLLGITTMHHLGYRGNGVQIAIIDAGFSKADKMRAFDSLFQNNRILGTKDFTNPGNNVYLENTHGTHVLSTIGGIIPNQYMGVAPDASFYLLRSETVASEYPVEEVYWLVAAEYADSIGVDLITTSLGYSTFDDENLDHTWNELDGKSAIISIAAETATKKGIMVVSSAGNEGASSWRKIQFPSDAENIISVGAVDVNSNYANFSSQGFSADNRIKPDVVCIGKQTLLIGTNDKIFKGNGTSFAAPTMAGAITLLIQAFPEKKPEDIRNALKKSSNNFQNPDSLVGYGIPNIFKAFLLLSGKSFPSLKDDKYFQVLPSPFKEDFFVYFSSNDTQMISIEIYDIAGKMVRKEENLKLIEGDNMFQIKGLSELTNGIYIVKIYDGINLYSRKIVKAN